MRQLFLDCETSAVDESQLLPIMPDFKPSGVLKDPEKIKADVAAKRQSWLDDAALKPTTGRVIAISAAVDDNPPEFHCSPDEKTMLDIAYHEIMETIGLGGRIYGWNLFGFDAPFLAARLCIHGVPAFKSFTVNYRGRWSWVENFTDPMQIWTGPYQRSDGASLKAVAYALGLGLKTGSGADFAALLKSDPIAAKEYSIRDVDLLRGIVTKIGI